MATAVDEPSVTNKLNGLTMTEDVKMSLNDEMGEKITCDKNGYDDETSKTSELSTPTTGKGTVGTQSLFHSFTIY